MERCPISCRQRIRQHCDRARRVADIAQHGSRFDEYASLTEHDCYPDGLLARHDDAQLVRLHCSSSDGPTLRRPPHAFTSHMKMARSKYGFPDYRRQPGTVGSRPHSRKPSINRETGQESEHADTVQRAPSPALNVAGLESSCFGKSALRTPRISRESVGASQASLHGLVSGEGIIGVLSSGCGRSDTSLLQRKKSKRSSRKFSCMSSADVLPTLTTFTPGTRHPLQAHIAPRFGEIQLDRCSSTRENSLTSSSNHNVDASNMVSSFAEVELSPLPASDAGNWSTLRLDASEFDSTVAIVADVPENSDLAQVMMVNDAENERQRNNPQPSFRSSAGAASHAYAADDVQRLTLTSGRDIAVAMDSGYYWRTSLDSRSSPPSAARSRAGCTNAAVLSNSASPPAPPSSSAASRNPRMPVLYENTCDQTSSSSSSCTISPDLRHNFGFPSYSSTFDSPNLGMVYSPEYYFHRRATRASHYWPFRRLPLHSYEETRNYFAASEILSARERVERDAISYEQMFMLEANLLLGGMSSYDQHQDLRLDIDSMSYEELLALEDSMGYVCTGLEKRMISECLKMDKYCKISLDATGPMPDCIEVKCSICQEDFEEGLDLGTLQCGHKHHFSCIEKWLQRKNECPICKKPAFLNRTT